MGQKQSGHHHQPSGPITHSGAAAQAAGLHYVADTQPGMRRQHIGRGFRYLGVDGTPSRDLEVLRRIKALMIPPAWTDV